MDAASLQELIVAEGVTFSGGVPDLDHVPRLS